MEEDREKGERGGGGYGESRSNYSRFAVGNAIDVRDLEDALNA